MKQYYDYKNFGYGELTIIDKNNLEWNYFNNNNEIIDNFMFEINKKLFSLNKLKNG